MRFSVGMKVLTKTPGGILSLPTGAGKTFTAVHFLCTKPLSEGYKVLWLAHTHHLLEQAYFAFPESASLINEPQKTLFRRVVSGTPGHFRVHAIEPRDDVVIGTLQTMSKALREKNVSFETFLRESGGKIFLVFDEAHHAPAPSYRSMIQELRKRFPSLRLLGLTATPYSENDSRAGWLVDLFPQKVIHIMTKCLMGRSWIMFPKKEKGFL